VENALCSEDIQQVEGAAITAKELVFPCAFLIRRTHYEGVPLNLLAIRNIASANAVEDELKERIREIEIITESIPNSIWKAQIDNEGKLSNTFISTSSNNLLNVPKGTILNSWEKFFSYVFPEYLPSIKNMLARGVENPGRIYTIEYRVKKGDGQLAWFCSRGMVIQRSSGNYAYGFTYDITHQKKVEEQLKISEKKFRLLVEKNPDGVVLINRKGKIVEWNKAIENITGVPAAEALNVLYWDLATKLLLDSDDRERFRSELQKLIQGTFAGENQEWLYQLHESEHKMVDGTEKNLASKHFEISADNKKFLCVLVRDVSESKRQELRLKELNETKDKFFSIISHDLKNPFTAFMGFSELMLRQMEKGQYENIDKYANAIFATARQGGELLTNLLDWSRSQRGEMKFMPEKLSAHHTIQSCLNFYQEYARNKELEIDAQVSCDFDFVADKNMIESVLRNLLNNAIKFSRRGDTVIVHGTYEGESAVFFVQDFGVGMPEEVQKELFKLSFHYSEPGTEREHGTGLGLMLCKEFVDYHHGTITVESRQDIGTKMVVSIPQKMSKE
jgi:PAS domain S-box-containing protein